MAAVLVRRQKLTRRLGHHMEVSKCCCACLVRCMYLWDRSYANANACSVYGGLFESFSRAKPNWEAIQLGLCGSMH